MDDLPTIAEFFRGRSVFITGGLGFMGKVLVEKLLRSCPDLDKIYLIVREKRGKDVYQRLQKALEVPLFDLLKLENPSAVEKVVVLPGDMMSLGLGLTPEHRTLLEENVSVVFHAAATVRFDDPIKSAVIMNVRGTREVLDIAANMKKLKVFVHVSTTYCNAYREHIGEHVYPALGDWKRMIKAVETLDETSLNALTCKLIGVMPNTYTYTKGLAEQMVKEYRQRMPVIIYRPSIVIGTFKEPISGWIDNFNGPIGMIVAGGKGIMRVMYAVPDINSDYMAVDIAIKLMVVAAWVEATRPKSDELPVYNASSGKLQQVSAQQLVDMGHVLGSETPLQYMLWAPHQRLTSNYVDYYVSVLLTHMLPALLVDAALKLAGRKPMLTKLQRHIFVANTAVSYFLFREWHFDNEKFVGLLDAVRPGDRTTWTVNPTEVNPRDFMRTSICGGRRYLLHEDDSTIPQSKINHNRMIWLDRVTRGLFYSLIVWYLYSHHVLQNAFTRVNDNLGELFAAFD